jgi:hypothetical protein
VVPAEDPKFFICSIMVWIYFLVFLLKMLREVGNWIQPFLDKLTGENWRLQEVVGNDLTD